MSRNMLCLLLNKINLNQVSYNQESAMYTSNEINTINEVREHLEKGDIDFDLYFAERTMDGVCFDQILDGFVGISLPDNLSLKVNFSSSNVEDDLVKYLADKLSKIYWPNKFSLTLSLRNNLLSNEDANTLLDLFEKFDRFPEAKVMIDLDNNNCLNSSVIGDALEKIKNSAVDGNAIVNKDKSKTIKFSDYLIEEYLSTDHENGDL